MRLALIYLETPLVRDGNGFRTKSVMNMLRHFPRVFETELICGVKDNGRDEGYFVDLSLMNILPLPPWNDVYDLHLYRFPAIAWRIFITFRKRHKSWDIVWITDCSPMTQFCFLLSKFYNIPVVLYLRGDIQKEILSRKKKPLKSLIARAFRLYLNITIPMMLRYCIGVVTGRTLFNKYKHYAKSLYRYVASSITQEILTYESPKSINNRYDIFRIIYVGELRAYKGIDVLLSAIARLKAAGISCFLDIVGKGPDEQKLKAISEELSLSKIVSFKGFVPFGEELFSLYRKAHIYVLPSYTEGSPKTVPEAMVFGLPVVASRVGGIPDLVDDGTDGILFEPGNSHELADALQKIIKDKELWGKMSLNAIEKAKHLTVEVQIDKLFDFIKSNLQ